MCLQYSEGYAASAAGDATGYVSSTAGGSAEVAGSSSAAAAAGSSALAAFPYGMGLPGYPAANTMLNHVPNVDDQFKRDKDAIYR